MDFLGKRLLFITAHPDDESFMAAGTIIKNKKMGGSSAIICATYGERGRSHVTERVTVPQLKQIRKQEFFKVSKFLRFDKAWGFGLPDKDLKSHVKKFLERSLPLAERYKPDYIVSFGPDGISGHQDHIAAYTVALRISKKLQVPFVAFALAPWFEKHFFTWLVERRKHGAYAKHDKFGKCNCKVRIEPALKMKALKMHKSQTCKGDPFTGYPPRAVKEWLGAEYFVVSPKK